MNPALHDLLKTQPALWRGSDRYDDGASVATGFAALDAILPARGWPVGGVTELLVSTPGIGELSLLLPALKRLTAEEARWAVLVNPPWVPYAPALANAGVRLDRLLIVAGKTDNDALWSAEQLLRAGVFAAVIAWVDRSTAQQQRRLQLAAEAGRGWATVYRPARAADEHSPVSLRMVLGVGRQTTSDVKAGSTARPAALPMTHDERQTLSIETIKVRGGTPARVSIDLADFDAPQGVEWPGLPVGSPGPSESSTRVDTDGVHRPGRPPP